LTAAPGAKRGSLGKAIGWSVAFMLLGIAVMSTLVVLWAFASHGSVAEGLKDLATPGPRQVLVGGLSQLLGFGFATWVVGFRVLHLKRAELRWAPARRGAAGFAIGLAVGGGAAILALLSAVVLAHSYWTNDQGGLGDYMASVGKTFAVLAPAALSEEIMFRGLPLVLMAAVVGRGTALVLVAGVLFALFHGLNPGVTMLGLGNIALAGIFLGVVFYVPGGIWTAFGAHLGWNTALAALDAPVSGLPFNIPWLDYRAGDPTWLSGGRFGPEGGLTSTLAITLALLVTLRWARREPA
jgi:membrane protease YdiL (CAAX protease family)